MIHMQNIILFSDFCQWEKCVLANMDQTLRTDGIANNQQLLNQYDMV